MIELFCRLPDCNNEERFESAEESIESSWTSISPMGAVRNSVVRHRAYCPDHS